MPRPSKVDKLPGEIREAISDLRERGHTLDEILQHLKAIELPDGLLPSRSGLGRHIQGLDALSERLHRSRSVAEALVRKFGDAPESRQSRLNIELMHSMVTDVMMAADAQAEGGGHVAFDPEQVMFMAKSLESLARASKTDTDMQIKIREVAEAKTKAAAVKATETVAKAQGLTKTTVDAIKAAILGVKVAA